MSFTFRKYLSTLAVKKISCSLFLVFLLFLLIFFFEKGVGKLIIGYFIVICLLYNIFRLSYLFVNVHKFLKQLSKEEKKTLESELSASDFSYDNCFLTDKYLFLLNKGIFIKYADIDRVRVTTSIKFRNKMNMLDGISYKVIIYSHCNTYLCFETNHRLLKDNFIKLLKLRNPSIKI